LGFGITLLFLLIISLLESRSVKSLMVASTFPALILASLAIVTHYLLMELKANGFEAFDVKSVFSIFGASMGIDIFLLLLFFTGIALIWSYIRTLRIYHLFSILLVLLSFFNPLVRVYASLVIVVYCVFSIKHLYYTKWELEIIKKGTIILLICALVFSSLSQVNTIINSEPGSEIMRVAGSLKKEQAGTVFTEEAQGFFLQYASEKRTMLDGNSRQYDDYYSIQGDYEYMLGLVRLKDAEPMIVKHSIRYFLITPDMKEKIWEGKESGLLLLLKNSEKFTRIDESTEGFELWKYIG
jgi:hypothetical protein